MAGQREPLVLPALEGKPGPGSLVASDFSDLLEHLSTMIVMEDPVSNDDSPRSFYDSNACSVCPMSGRFGC